MSFRLLRDPGVSRLIWKPQVNFDPLWIIPKAFCFFEIDPVLLRIRAALGRVIFELHLPTNASPGGVIKRVKTTHFLLNRGRIGQFWCNLNRSALVGKVVCSM